MSNEISVYTPDNSLNKGYFNLYLEIYNDIIKNRWLTFQLFKRDFTAIYQQSLIGILWVLIMPLFTVLIFILLNQSGIFNIGTINVPYPIFAVIGMAFWQLFSVGLVASSGSIVNAGSMVSKINFSKKSLVIASLGQSVISFIIQMALVLLLFFYYGFTPSTYILIVPIATLPLLLFTLGMGFLCALLNSIVRDVTNVISLVTTLLMFLTPIFYDKPKTGVLYYLTIYNPLYYFISMPRDLALFGTMPDGNGFIVASLLSIAFFMLSLIIFHLSETRLAERI